MISVYSIVWGLHRYRSDSSNRKINTVQRPERKVKDNALCEMLSHRAFLLMKSVGSIAQDN